MVAGPVARRPRRCSDRARWARSGAETPSWRTTPNISPRPRTVAIAGSSSSPAARRSPRVRTRASNPGSAQIAKRLQGRRGDQRAMPANVEAVVAGLQDVSRGPAR